MAAMLAAPPAAVAQPQEDSQTVMEAFEQADQAASDINVMTVLDDVTIVEVADVAEKEVASQIADRMIENISHVRSMQTALMANALVASALQERQVEPTRVVAAKVKDGSKLTVYVAEPGLR